MQYEPPGRGSEPDTRGHWSVPAAHGHQERRQETPPAAPVTDVSRASLNASDMTAASMQERLRAEGAAVVKGFLRLAQPVTLAVKDL